MEISARTKPVGEDGKAATASKIKETLNGKSIEYALNPDGTIYLIPGTAGPKVYYKNKTIDPSYYNLFEVADENHASAYGPDPGDSGRPVRSQIQNFIDITVDSGRLTVVSYEIDQSKNNAQPYIVDQFGIAKNGNQKALTGAAQSTYTVVSGDFLWKIAAKFNLAWEALAELNKLKNPNMIYPGQKLIVPTK